jgi:hypothetical protein
MHWFIASLLHCFTDSWTRYFIHSLLHWFIASLLHWFILIHWCLDPLTIDSLLHCFVPRSIHWFLDSLVHWLINSLVRWFIQSIAHGFFNVMSLAPQQHSTTICSLVDAPHHFHTWLLLHFTNFPIGHLLPITVLNFRNFRPGMGRALPGRITCELPQESAV